MAEYTPTTDQVREVYCTPQSMAEALDDMAAWNQGKDFDRWLAAHDAEVRSGVAREIEAEREDTDHDAPGADAYINGLLRSETIAREGR